MKTTKTLILISTVLHFSIVAWHALAPEKLQWIHGQQMGGAVTLFALLVIGTIVIYSIDDKSNRRRK